MANYYFLTTLLPTLSFNKPLEFSFEEMERFFDDHLRKKDLEKLRMLRRFFDLFNLKALWLGEEINERGLFTAVALEEAIASKTGLSEEIEEFLEHYQKKEERISRFPFLLARFFQNKEALSDSFLRTYFKFERELRLVMTSYRAHRLKRELTVELQDENPEEEFIAQLLAQKEAKEFEFPEKYQEIKEIFQLHQKDPMALERALDHYRFDKIGELGQNASVFSIERLLVFFLQFLLVERWERLSIQIKKIVKS